MKAIFHYDAGPRLQARFAALRADGFDDCALSGGGRSNARRAAARDGGAAACPEAGDRFDHRAGPRLRLIQKIGVGVNTIDLAAARARGIAVANMPGTNTPAVAEAALLLMLAALRNLAGLDRACRAGTGWEAGPALQEHAGELRGRVVGLVGAGMVPQALVPMLHGLGARPVYWSRTEHPELGIPRLELDELLATADIVSLHLPLVPETERLIDGAALARMKPGAILVNTARGGLVDEAALVAALTSGHLRAAGLDVFAEEPVRPDNPLLALDNVVLMPHVAWLTPETLDRSLDIAIENMRRLRAGAELRVPGGVRRITPACYSGLAALALPPSRPARLRWRLMSIVTVAVIPARSGGSPWCGSSRTRTGRRCTTLTQLPEAFCGGRIANSAPVAGLMLSTSALQVTSG